MDDLGFFRSIPCVSWEKPLMHSLQGPLSQPPLPPFRYDPAAFPFCSSLSFYRPFEKLFCAFLILSAFAGTIPHVPLPCAYNIKTPTGCGCTPPVFFSFLLIDRHAGLLPARPLPLLQTGQPSSSILLSFTRSKTLHTPSWFKSTADSSSSVSSTFPRIKSMT